jgi:excisionase family DNA binding protein
MSLLTALRPPAATPGPRYLTVSEAAETARVSPVTVHRWIREGRLRSYLAVGRRLIAAEDLDRFIRGEAMDT